MPRAPFRARHADGPAPAIDIEHDSPAGRLFARVISDNGGYHSKIDQCTKSLSDVVDVQRGPAIDEWRIETSIFTCCWPQGYQLCSNSFPDDPGPFDLIGVNDELIYIQKPKVLPHVEKMVAPNQTVVDVHCGHESEWIELEYDHDGESWRQRHEVVLLLGERFVVTMQSLSDSVEATVDAARQVARSLRPAESVT